ncbi:MAG: MiaB/RimO family radical SAM methylthiotransferase [Synergistaceae bacterium]|nr:MiaB/RimO family radical SAM methylthiotransferase [Synergistaceae bacterium]
MEANKKIFIHVFGCRSSLCEGEYIAGVLKSEGFEITEDINDKYSAAVIVTCSVTQEADRKCRQAIRRARRVLGDEGVLAVCGCWSQALDENKAAFLGIDILCGSKGKDILPRALILVLEKGRLFIDLRELNNNKDIWAPSEWEELKISSPVMHSRAFMKIQDGCDHFCTYCVIPFLRGRPVSRPPEKIIDEIKRLLDNGTKEIIFTGIHLGIYGRDIDTSLANLINEVSKIENLKRLRLGSLEPFCLNDDLINALGNCEAFCHHLHLPLQSGDDEILSAMRRGYTAKNFVEVCDKVREKISDEIHISSDILVGFPGENEVAFQNTLSIMRDAGLGRVHVFPYSRRPGTVAEKLTPYVPHSQKVERTSQAIALGRQLYSNYVKKFLNREVEILIERDNKGHTRHYIEATCNGNDNEILKAEALRYVNDKLECERRN